MTTNSLSPAAAPKTAQRALTRWLGTGALALALAGAAGLAAAAPHGPRGHDGGFGGGPGMGMGLPLMGGPMMERMLDGVGASAEQKGQVRQILQAARDELRTQREAGRSLQQQMGRLFTQPTVDANAAEQLRQQMSTQREQASRRMLQAMLEVSRVLSPEQRAKLVEQAARARAMMERHRAERESLNRPGR